MKGHVESIPRSYCKDWKIIYFLWSAEVIANIVGELAEGME